MGAAQRAQRCPGSNPATAAWLRLQASALAWVRTGTGIMPRGCPELNETSGDLSGLTQLAMLPATGHGLLVGNRVLVPGFQPEFNYYYTANGGA